MPSGRFTFTPPLPPALLSKLNTEPSPLSLSLYLNFPATTHFRDTLVDILQALELDSTNFQTVSFLLSRGCPAGGVSTETDYTKIDYSGTELLSKYKKYSAIAEFSLYPLHLQAKPPKPAKGQVQERSYIEHIYRAVESARNGSVAVRQEKLCAVLEGNLRDVLGMLQRVWGYDDEFPVWDDMGEGVGHVVVQGVMKVGVWPLDQDI